MSVQAERRGFIPRFFGNRTDSHNGHSEIPVVSKLGKDLTYLFISENANRAVNIWNDGKGRKKERYGKIAQDVLVHLPEAISEPEFYQRVEGVTHVEVLKLLSEGLVPSEADNPYRFKERKERMINLYLQGIVKHRPTIKDRTGEVVFIGSEDINYIDKLRSYLRNNSRIRLDDYAAVSEKPA